MVRFASRVHTRIYWRCTACTGSFTSCSIQIHLRRPPNRNRKRSSFTEREGRAFLSAKAWAEKPPRRNDAVSTTRVSGWDKMAVMWNDTDLPLGYLITFRCYGTWLHGDERGSID